MAVTSASYRMCITPDRHRADRRFSAPRHGTARMADQLQIRRFCVRWHTIVIAARARGLRIRRSSGRRRGAPWRRVRAQRGRLGWRDSCCLALKPGLAPGPERGICQCRLVSILCMACHYPWTADDLLFALVRAGHLEPSQHVADGLLSAADRPQDGLAGVTSLQARLRAAQVLTEAGRAEDAIAIAPPAVLAAGGDADGSARMQASGVLAEAGAADEATALALAVAGERPGYAHVYLVAVSLWLAAYGYLPQATRLAAEAVADAARMRSSAARRALAGRWSRRMGYVRSAFTVAGWAVSRSSAGISGAIRTSMGSAGLAASGPGSGSPRRHGG